MFNYFKALLYNTINLVDTVCGPILEIASELAKVMQSDKLYDGVNFFQSNANKAKKIPK